ncbi:MAG: beta-ribofuranosylaminobenzene 5'-phosphate synthase [Nitrososphaerales archaeon]
MIRVKTPSRLHITLIDLNGKIGRVDGGVGVALEEPSIILEAELIDNGIKVEGDNNGRAFEAAKRTLKAYNLKGGLSIRVIQKYDEHVGLGFGTQLSLGVAFAIINLHKIHASPRKLAEIVGRGGTSGIGVAAFEYGGFIVDGGHTFGINKQKQSFLPSSASKAPPPPVISRLDFPEDWLAILAIPKVNQRIHGSLEVELFSKYCPIPIDEVQALSHIILMKLLPSLAEKDIVEFGDAITKIQNIGFKKIELGLQSDEVKKIMRIMTEAGAYGVGLSSFGPTLYTFVDNKKKALAIAKAVEDCMGEVKGRVLITKSNNKGVEISIKSIRL